MMYHCYSIHTTSAFAAGTNLVELLDKAIRKPPQTLRIVTDDVTSWFLRLLGTSFLDWREVESQIYLEQYNRNALES